MKKMFLFFVLSLLLCIMSGYAQTLTVNTFGVSPRDVTKDTATVKYFDRAYNGLKNVGNQTKIFLQVTKSTKLTSPVWSFVSKPYMSTASFGTTKNLDTLNQVVSFIPDKVGTYKIIVTDGTLTANISINSSLYVGIETGACNWCHNGGTIVSPDPIYSKWTKTGHATMLFKGLEGVASNHYSAACISCHTTGYDLNAVNNGFDDWPFSFPTKLQTGMFDSMKVVYPKAMAYANIQCESCHGPGGNHYSATDDSKMVKTLSADNCAWCHDSGTHHFFPEQYDASVHANPSYYQYQYSGTRATCARCHNGAGFVEYIKGGNVDLTTAPTLEKISCAVCHDPHDATNLHQVRTASAKLANNVSVTTSNAGLGVLCMNCHQSRVNAVDYTNNYKANLTRFGPHHGPQGDMIMGTNGIDFGWKFPTSPHATAADGCIACHMATAGANPDGSIMKVGSHSLNMKDPQTGADNVAACTPCHGTIGTKFSDKKYYVNGNADLDKDGTVKGLQDEIQGLLDKLAKKLPPLGSTTVTVDSSYTLVQAQAAYNYMFVLEDKSLGIHNPSYAYTLLAVALQKLDPTTDIKLIDNNVPQTFVLEQNYPNPFNPTTNIKYSVPQQGNVKIEIYDIMGKLVTTLVNQDMNAGTYTATWDGTNMHGQKVVSGIYLYRLQATDFVSVKKMIMLK